MSVLNADYRANSTTASFEDYSKTLFKQNPDLPNNLVLSNPIIGVLPIIPGNSFQKYIDVTQLLTQSGAPIKGKIAKTESTSGDNYYFITYPPYKIIESIHQAYLADTEDLQPVDLSFINEFRFTGNTGNIELNMNRIDKMVGAIDATNMAALKNGQLTQLQKIIISDIVGDVRIAKSSFAGYNLESLTNITISNITGRVIIEDDAFADTKIPKLRSIVFNNISEGLILKNNIFENAIISPDSMSLTFTNIQNELSIGNNIFDSFSPKNIVNFQNNTSRISIVDKNLQGLIKITLHSDIQNTTQIVPITDFQKILSKLTNIENLIRTGFGKILGPDPLTQSNPQQISTFPTLASPTFTSYPNSHTSKINQQGLAQRLEACKKSQGFIGFVFLGANGFLLAYTIRKQFA